MWGEDTSQGVMMITGHCGRCGVLVSGLCETMPTIWVDTRTLCNVRPDGADVTPRDRDADHTTQAILCGGCANVLAQYARQQARIVDMFPLANLELIDVDARLAIQRAKAGV